MKVATMPATGSDIAVLRLGQQPDAERDAR